MFMEIKRHFQSINFNLMSAVNVKGDGNGKYIRGILSGGKTVTEIDSADFKAAIDLINESYIRNILHAPSYLALPLNFQRQLTAHYLQFYDPRSVLTSETTLPAVLQTVVRFELLRPDGSIESFPDSYWRPLCKPRFQVAWSANQVAPPGYQLSATSLNPPLVDTAACFPARSS